MAGRRTFRTTLAPVKPWDKGAPRINGPRVFGARPGSVFFFPVPATGARPMTFSAKGLPKGLAIDPDSGIITGSVAAKTTRTATVTAVNRLGRDERTLRIVIGDKIALTPPLGWNSWNVWAAKIDDQKVRDCADAMVASGLAAHGYSYVNIDDGWQGERGGPLDALQPNEKFPDMKALCGYVHSRGLRIGIYTTPWVKSYARYNGGSSGECVRFEPGTGRPETDKDHGWYFGAHPGHNEDAKQWAEWGMDYLKYDWNPWRVPDVAAMADALRACGRDIVYSLSNSGQLAGAADWARLANCWRTTGDIIDTWDSVSSIGFTQDRWTPYGGPGHWNDPDMLVVGKLGWGEARKNRLTKDEQITHITLWALLAAPFLLGCDLTQLDDFTRRLMCNDEMLDVLQDPLGRQGHCVRETRETDRRGRVTARYSVCERELEDGGIAVGLFNRDDAPRVVGVTWADLGLRGTRRVRDVWANADLGRFSNKFSMGVPPHGAQLVVIGK